MTQRPAKFWEGSTLAELQALGSNDGLTVLDFGVVETGTPGVYQATTVNPTTSVWTATGGVGSVDLQQAYDNGASIVTDAAGGPIQISGTQGFEISAPSSSGLVEADEITLRATGVSDFFIEAPNGVIFDGAKQIDATAPFKFDDGAGGFQIVRGADPAAANDLATKNYVDSNVGEVNTASNIGTGEGVFSAKVGDDFEFKSLTASGLVSVSSSATEIDISTTAEANTASNLGGGEGVFSAKVGDDLQFRSLTAAGSVSLTGSGTEIEISSTGEANTASNIGAGEGVFSAKVGDDFEFKSITVKYSNRDRYHLDRRGQHGLQPWRRRGDLRLEGCRRPAVQVGDIDRGDHRDHLNGHRGEHRSGRGRGRGQHRVQHRGRRGRLRLEGWDGS